jgi:peptidoglycan/LPS O-acetylase OafA/YrhL
MPAEPIATSWAQPRASEARWEFPPWGRLAYVDGVRAIAILAVIGFHARLPGFRGGFVGVDVFFVISGFLITHQIATQQLTGRFSAMDFYARRVLRIFPPLLFVTLATLALAALFPLLPLENRELAKSAAATAAMISNYFFSASADYFAPQAEINPLLHTWSLGVEEQYYLLTPVAMSAVVALAVRRNWNARHALLACALIALAISYIAMEIVNIHDRRVAFFSIMTRSWQFAAGGALALASLQGSPVPPRLRSAIGVIGLLAIAASVVLYNEHLRYPGGATGLLPTCGAALLLASGLGNDRAPLTRILASRPAVAIGVLSYSWYLWHWPLTELARTLPIGQDSIWKDVASDGVALLLSVPTYLLIERPMKSLRRPSFTRAFGGRIVVLGVGGSALVAALALLLARSPLTERTLAGLPAATSYQSVTNCRPGPGLPKFSHMMPCVVGADAEPSVAVIGDSHALVLSPIAQDSAKALGKAAVIVSTSTCPPLLGVDVSYFVRSTCARTNNEILAWLNGGQSSISGAVLAARWSFYNEQDAPGREGILPKLVWTDGKGRSRDYATMMGEGLADFIAALGPNRRVLIVGPAPELKHPIGDCLQRAQLTGQPPQSCAVRRADVELRHRQAWQVLHAVAAKFPNSRLIDPAEVLCDAETCRPFNANGLLYVDKDHLSVLGTTLLYRRFELDFRWVYGAGPAQ